MSPFVFHRKNDKGEKKHGYPFKKVILFFALVCKVLDFHILFHFWKYCKELYRRSEIIEFFWSHEETKEADDENNNKCDCAWDMT